MTKPQDKTAEEIRLERKLAAVRGQITRLRHDEEALVKAIEDHKKVDVAMGIGGGLLLEAAGVGVGALLGA